MQPAATATTFPGFARGIGVRQVRIFCGCILFSYLLTHFTCHALGNLSLDAMEYGLQFHVALWQSVLGTWMFYPALVTHGGLGLYALYQRRNFKWAWSEGLQLALGLSIPLLLMHHLSVQRIAYSYFGLSKGYAQALYGFFFTRPDMGLVQVVLVLVAWTHGCLGLYFWLRLKRFFPRWAPLLLGGAVLLPALALLGYWQGGRAVTQLSASPEWRAQNVSPARIGTPAQGATLRDIRDQLWIAYGGLVGLALAARGVRSLRERRGGMVRLTYPERSVRVPRGMSVLEASLRHKVPHASVCGGKGRCSTCRIRVIGELGGVPPPSAREAFVLQRVGASADPAVRLACPLRPQQDIAFVPLLPPQVSTSFVHGKSRVHPGEERYVVSMFVDLRGSTGLAENRLPFDTVFIVNRFLAAVAHAVIEAGGQPNQYLGDGHLALFGLDCAPAAACRRALHAAALVAANVAHLNEIFAESLRQPLRFGIGIHGGEVIIGDVGYRDHLVFTAMGDPVNVAARLQDMSKELQCEVVVSDEVRRAAGLAPEALPSTEVAIRGRAEPMRVYKVGEAAILAALLDGDAAAPAAVHRA
jgi:adenylate cyclase